MKPRPPTLPPAPMSIQKGTPLKELLNPTAIECLAQNIRYVHNGFDVDGFRACALADLEPLALMQRGQHIANALRQFLPEPYAEAIELLVESFTPAQTGTDGSDLAVFFYLPHSFFISTYGQDPQYNNGRDPFDISMRTLHALTTRFTSEFAIRPFLIRQQDRTLAQVSTWLDDPNQHVRRLCTEGTRPRLPWGKRIPAFIADPRHTLPILDALKNDPSPYVRRSVANHLGDIAKDHPDFVFSTCARWLEEDASKEIKSLIRHAVRHPAKKGNPRALELRTAAKA